MAAEIIFRNKHSKYLAVEATREFVAFDVETLGPWAKETKYLVGGA